MTLLIQFQNLKIPNQNLPNDRLSATAKCSFSRNDLPWIFYQNKQLNVPKSKLIELKKVVPIAVSSYLLVKIGTSTGAIILGNAYCPFSPFSLFSSIMAPFGVLLESSLPFFPSQSNQKILVWHQFLDYKVLDGLQWLQHYIEQIEVILELLTHWQIICSSDIWLELLL